MIRSTVSSLLSEEKEKKRRKLYLIIHKIPESTLEDSSKRKAHDTEQVNFFVKHYLKVNAEVFSPVASWQKRSWKTRLLKVEVSSEKVKKMVPCNSTKLHDESNPDHIRKIKTSGSESRGQEVAACIHVLGQCDHYSYLHRWTV